ncbi:hypothetical protein [Streptomyces sp. SM11]|uniref:hypothetical protein n=1 Tax=Streptomyces sp. SM11 TaxID=565557 RepID=UPI000CD5C1C3|nr:hypothetical protein [Streptomyces sp. SM11]
MHADVHHLLHAARAAELQSQTTEFPLPRTALRTRVGRTLVVVGLRLTGESRETAATAPRTSAIRTA